MTRTSTSPIPDWTELQPRLLAALSAPEPQLEPFADEIVRTGAGHPEQVDAMLFEVVARLNAGWFPPVTKMELIHTEGCNLACEYCFEKNMLGYRKMPPEIGTRAVDLLFRYAGDEREISITHFGGEPTVNMRAVRHVTDYAQREADRLGKRVTFHMTSNGTLFDESTVEYLAGAGIRVLLSLDGLAESHDRYRRDRLGRGTFAETLRGLRLLKRVQPWIGTKMTVMPDNVPRLHDDVRGLHDLGVNQFLIGHATGVPWPRPAQVELGRQLQRLRQWYDAQPHDDLRITDFEEEEHAEPGGFFGCQAGATSISISVRGEISPCSKIMGIDSRRLLAKLGDVRFGLTHLRTRRELVSCSSVRAACERQGIADSYRGGCFASNFTDTGDLYEPSLQDHALSLIRHDACVGCSARA